MRLPAQLTLLLGTRTANSLRQADQARHLDAVTGEQLRELTIPGQQVQSVAWSPDGKSSPPAGTTGPSSGTRPPANNSAS